ncbi:acryloyl-CoA reductase [Rathayibacter sp. YIM 133350]|uniref:acrylyl-CoA reductase family protein n=1 Tax=Rathayibacter sp. YIM 133350 TaxID=3131992 RepID=UPI00307D6CE5
MSETFRAIVVDRETDAEGRPSLTSGIRELRVDDLREGDAAPHGDTVLIETLYSSLNYKDGMAVRGKPGITRAYPIVAGIDLVGRVASSEDSRWSAGDVVVLNGAGLSETRHGGFTERAVVESASLVAVPAGISPRQAAAIGTAGVTAMLAVLALERYGIHPELGPVLVSGASGGVGSVGIAILGRHGYEVAALTGRGDENGDYLRRLGAVQIVDRDEFAEPGRPLQSQRWAAGIDSIGGVPLANLLSQIEYGGAVAACGVAASSDLPTTVLPFILRGVALLGVNSVEAPLFLREEAWTRLATDLDLELLEAMTTEITLDEVADAGAEILEGRTRGRVVVRIGR